MASCNTNIIDKIDRHAGGGVVTAATAKTKKLGNLGLSTQKCALLEDEVNDARHARGVANIDAGTIKTTTTIGEVETYACG